MVSSSAVSERPGLARGTANSVICTETNRIGPLHPSRRLCNYAEPSSLTATVGASPSGKAPVFGIGIPRFESWRPSHFFSSSLTRNHEFRAVFASLRLAGLA